MRYGNPSYPSFLFLRVQKRYTLEKLCWTAASVYRLRGRLRRYCLILTKIDQSSVGKNFWQWSESSTLGSNRRTLIFIYQPTECAKTNSTVDSSNFARLQPKSIRVWLENFFCDGRNFLPSDLIRKHQSLIDRLIKHSYIALTKSNIMMSWTRRLCSSNLLAFEKLIYL